MFMHRKKKKEKKHSPHLSHKSDAGRKIEPELIRKKLKNEYKKYIHIY
jgi:hypothetical protein